MIDEKPSSKLLLAQQELNRLHLQLLQTQTAIERKHFYTSSNTLHYSIDLPFPNIVTVGEGVYLPFCGWCFDTSELIKGISVSVGEKVYYLTHIHDLRVDVFTDHRSSYSGYKSLSSGFYGLIPFVKDDIEKKLKTTLNIYYKDRINTIDIGYVYCQSKNVVETVSPLIKDKNITEPLIAVCMTTYNPKIESFKIQIQSIINQTHQNWILIVNDDCSSEKIFKKISEVCQIDPRIYVFRNDTNFGFYKNFERTIERVGHEVEYVALADQDDYWYENKLSCCLASMEADVSLVYSDMRIVRSNGEVISNTYWLNRQNHYDDISMLLLANTVTGAAALFRRNLLEILLPFPYPIGEIYHDQWLSIVARSVGRIAYIDKPLYDYIQHGLNVIGHSDFQATSLSKRFIKGFQTVFSFTFSPYSIKPILEEAIQRAWAIYQYELRRLELMAKNLRLRVGDRAVVDLSALDIFNDRWFSVLGLMRKHIALLNTHTTNHAEWRLLKSRIVVTLSKRCAFFLEKLSTNNKLSSNQVSDSKNLILEDKIYFQTELDIKTLPLNLDISKSHPKRVNLLIPEINFKHLFGGYIGKFNFAMSLTKIGLKVRLVVVDNCDFSLDDIQRGLLGYPGLEEMLSHIEISLQHDRQVKLSVNPLDSFIATTWWTAHIAHAACTQLKHSEFLYFIQEFEPFTFPMGSHFALAYQSYQFPHSALFSTPLLMEYFQQQKIGVFTPELKHSLLKECFENAIQTFELPSVSPEKYSKKLLFYSRPESHAVRNMFEMALMALNKAILSGAFDSEAWEFYGIGTEKLKYIPLVNGRTLQMLGKVSLNRYRELLPQYDIGLALMYTPHPSLLPLEMAAAGMITVTNTCLNKTKDRLKAISENILAAEPTVDCIAESLSKAVILSQDWNYRLAGSRVNWSSSWQQTFDEKLLLKIKAKLNHEY